MWGPAAVRGRLLQEHCFRQASRSDRFQFPGEAELWGQLCGNPRLPLENWGSERFQIGKLNAGHGPWNIKLQQSSVGPSSLSFGRNVFSSEKDSILELNREKNFSLFPNSLLVPLDRKALLRTEKRLLQRRQISPFKSLVIFTPKF